MKRFPWLPSVGAGVSILFFAVMLARAVWLDIDIRRAERELAARNAVTMRNASGREKNAGSELSRLAKKAGVAKLLGVSLRDGGAAKTLSVEWESTPAATLAFLDLLRSGGGACLSLVVTPSESPRDVRARGVFEDRPFAATEYSTPSVTTPRLARNAFAPLWRDSSVALAERQSREREKEELARARDQEKAEKDRRVQEEAQREQAKRRSLETQLIVTGIVNNGREPMAFVSAQGAGGRTLMLRSGDIVDEARVTAIDEKKGEVLLDYAGKFEVVLKLQGSVQ